MVSTTAYSRAARDMRVAPLSPAQQALWLADRLSPAGGAHTIAVALLLHGPLDVAVLERSLLEVVRRHETLRTIFQERDGKFVQIVVAPPPRILRIVDLEALAPAARRRTVGRLSVEESGVPFDLARGPLLRVTLVRV